MKEWSNALTALFMHKKSKLKKSRRIGMDGLSKKLTEKDVTEALSQREELLECYRQRLAMLSKEYEDSEESIEILQMRSSRNDLGNSKGGFAHGLDDIYLLYEKQKKKYKEEIYQNMLQIVDSINQVNNIYLCYLQLPSREQMIIKEIYIEGKMYKEVIRDGLSSQTINRLRKKAIKKILQDLQIIRNNDIK